MKSIDARRMLGLILMGIGLLFAAFCLSGQLNGSAQGAPTPQPDYGPLVPTPNGKPPSDRSTLPGVLTPTATPSSLLAAQSIMPSLYTPRQRVGVGAPFPERVAKPLSELRPGWYLDWRYAEFPAGPGA